LATAAVVVLAGVGLGGAALAGVGPLAGPRSGPDLSPMEQAYIDLAVDLDPAVRVQLDYTQDVDALVILGLETATQPHLNELGSAVKQALDGQDAFIFLYDPTVELIEALAGLQTSSLKLAVTRGVDPSELISAFVRSNVTALMLEELLLPSGTSTFDSVTHLSFFNPTLRGLELATSLFPNLTSLSVGCEDDKVEYWRATSLERTSHLTNLNVGAGHGLWYDPAWLPEETTVDAESLALWLVDHPYTIKAFNGQPLVGFKLTVSQSDLHSYRAWSLREFTSEILSDEAPAYQPGPGEFGLSGGLAVTLKSPPSGWSDSHQAAASGQEYHGLPADRLAQVPEDLRFIAQITLRAGPQEGNNIYRNSAGEITGLALYGLTSVQVFDLTDHIAYAAVDTGSSPAPDRVYSNGDHHGPMLPQTAVDRLIASLI
jgi:hypothetical protein